MGRKTRAQIVTNMKIEAEIVFIFVSVSFTLLFGTRMESIVWGVIVASICALMTNAADLWGVSSGEVRRGAQVAFGFGALCMFSFATLVPGANPHFVAWFGIIAFLFAIGILPLIIGDVP